MVKAVIIITFKINLEEMPGGDELSCLWKLRLSAS